MSVLNSTEYKNCQKNNFCLFDNYNDIEKDDQKCDKILYQKLKAKFHLKKMSAWFSNAPHKPIIPLN